MLYETCVVWPDEPVGGCGTKEEARFNRAAPRRGYDLDFVLRNKLSLPQLTLHMMSNEDFIHMHNSNLSTSSTFCLVVRCRCPPFSQQSA